MANGVDALIQGHMDERESKVTVIQTIADTAASEGRDLYETELETISNARSRIVALDKQIEAVSGQLEMADTIRTRIRTLDPSVMSKDWSYRTAGDYLWDALHRANDHDANDRFQRFHKRAAEHMGLDKANTIPVAGGFNGLVINPVVGTVLDPSPQGRPLFTALGVRPITSMTFLRPRIVDPNFATGVGPQGQEKSELPSKAWDILSDPVTAEIVGGYINVSQLLIEMLSGSLDMVISHMNRRLEQASETAAVAELDKTTAEIPLAADADAAAINAAIGQAAALVVANTGRLPTWMAMGPTAWGRLIGVSDAAGRPLLPNVGAANAIGTASADSYFTNVRGLTTVVTHAITNANVYVGNTFGLEVYEKPMPVLQAVEPSVFGRQISVQTALAFYRPVTSEAGPGNVPPAENNGVVKIEWA